MPKKDFVPRAIGAFIDWHDNIKVKLPIIGPTVGLIGSDINPIVNDNTTVHTNHNNAVTKKAESTSASAIQVEFHAETADRIRRARAKAKTHPNVDPTKAEMRYYQAQYLDGDEAVGPVSDILAVSVPAA